ncbi:MAG: formate--tetrahydrofolate ligase [Deltaproteobacteria bacterium]|nr:formate--tetrahydrofolate ligase [Deltaproteobacteria bacterium]
MRTDAEIGLSFRLKPIDEIAGGLGIPEERLIHYGRHIAKVDSRLLDELRERPDGRLILVTAMSPTPSGDGKTTLTIGIAQSLRLLGKKAAACLRQPSLGPFFGAKGGATGGGYSQVLPAGDITIQFTGDDYAITTAHNFISSIIDNHIFHDTLPIDPERILWPRASTVNDRTLRKLRVPVGKSGGERAEEFVISAASELMSILSLSLNLTDFRERAGRIVVAFSRDGRPVTVGDLGVTGAVAALFKNAIHPNLVQSNEGAPVFIHGGPFGNISIGCSSLLATRLALKSADYVLTEAGFATELGAEKFFDIKCRYGGLKPSVAVIVATLKALRLHGGSKDYLKEDTTSMIKGLENIEKHIENIKKFGVPFIVAVNRYHDDTDGEILALRRALGDKGIPAHLVDVRERGGAGGVEAAEALVELTQNPCDFKYLYPLEIPVADKINIVAREMYGASGVEFTGEAKRDIAEAVRLGFSTLPVCIAKTPKSLSDDPNLLGRPTGFKVAVRRVKIDAGAGFLVAICGNVLLMPGLPMHPLAEEIDINSDGTIRGF